MNKFMQVLAASALVATALVGCGKSSTYAKVGLGVISTLSDDGQVNTTFAAVGLDGDGKIVYVDVDVAQSTPGDQAGAKTETKKQLKEKYDMKKASGIQKEWYEQIAAFEQHCTGKTGDEVAAIETEKKDEHHDAVPKAGSDLATGCTMNIGEFQAAVKKACDNAVEVEADKVGLGRLMSNDAEQKQLNTNLALVATDADGKIVYSKIDVAQIYEGVLETKSERKDKYDMKKASPIQKEWYEQAAAFEAALNGKNLDEVKAIEVEDYHGGKAAKKGTDLAAGCTITIDAFLATVESALGDLH